MKDNYDINNLIKKCQQGDNDSFAVLVDLYSGKLYAYFLRLTGNEDISNELLSNVYLKLVDKIGSFNGGSFNSWIYRIASNIFYDHLRQKHKDKKFMEASSLSYTDEGRDETELVDIKDLLQSALPSLDDLTRECLIMRYYSDLSFKEIAEIKSSPIGTILGRVHRGLAKLKEVMSRG